MNRRERALSPDAPYRSRPRLLPRIPRFGRSNSTAGGSSLQQRQQRQRQQRQEELSGRLLEQLHSPGAEGESADLIEKFELLPDDSNDREETGEEDSIFSEEKGSIFSGETGGGGSEAIELEYHEQPEMEVSEPTPDGNTLRVRRKLQEVALEEAMSAPGRSQRQILAGDASSRATRHDTLDAFLATKERRSRDAKSAVSGVSSVTMTVQTAELGSIMTANRKQTDAEMGSLLAKTVMTAELGSLLTKEEVPEKAATVADGIEDSPTASSNSNSSRSDDLPGLKENRSDLYQPNLIDTDCSSRDEHRQSPEHSSESSKGSPEQQSACQRVICTDSPAQAPSILCHLPTLGETVAKIASPATKGIKLLPKNRASTSSSNHSSNSFPTPEVTDTASSEGEISSKESSDSNSIVLNGSSDSIGLDNKMDRKKEAGYNIQQSLSKEAVECTIAPGTKENGEELEEAAARSSTPRTAILEEQGWSHHHRYARHRVPDSEQAAKAPVVVPLNRLSSALVVSSGATSSAKDLSELQSWTAELTTLRTWKANAEKSLKENEMELGALRSWKDYAERKDEEHAKANTELELLKGQVATLLDEREGHEAKSRELELRVESATSDVAEWKTAAEDAVKENSKEIALLSETNAILKLEKGKLEEYVETCKTQLESEASQARNGTSELCKAHSEAKAEIERLRVNLETCKAELQTAVTAVEEEQVSSVAMQATMENFEEELRKSEAREAKLELEDEKAKQTIEQLEASLQTKEEEVDALNERVGSMADEATKLQAELDEANMTKDVTSVQLSELKSWVEERDEEHKISDIERKQSADDKSSDIEALREQLEERDALVEEKNGQLEACLRDVDELKLLVDQLNAKLDEAENTELQELKENLASVRASTLEEDVSLLKSQLKEANAEREKIREMLDAAVNEKEKVAKAALEADQAKATLESKLEELKAELALANNERGRIEEKVVTLNDQLLHEKASSAEGEKALAEVRDLREQIQAAKDAVEEKTEEVSTLNDAVGRLENELKGAKDVCDKKLVEVDENSRLQSTLSAKEKESMQLQEELHEATSKARKLKDEIESMKVMSEMASVELTELKAWKSDAEKKTEKQIDGVKVMQSLAKQCEAKEETIGEKENEISTLTASLRDAEEQSRLLAEHLKVAKDELERKVKAASDETRAQFQLKVKHLQKEKHLLETDAASKVEVISELISKNEQVVAENDELKLWKEGAILNCEQEKVASGVLSQRIIDVELELEGQRSKYQEATAALTDMEAVVRVQSHFGTLAHKQEKVTDKENEISTLRREYGVQTASLLDAKERVKLLEERLKTAENELEQKIKAAEDELKANVELKIADLNKEKHFLEMDSSSKLSVISELITTNEQVVAENDELKRWKEDAELDREQEKIASKVLAQRLVDLEVELEGKRNNLDNATTALSEMGAALTSKEAALKFEQEKIASGVLAQRLVDLEMELEGQRTKYLEATTVIVDLEVELEGQRAKYKDAKTALTEMQTVLMTVEEQRMKLLRR